MWSRKSGEVELGGEMVGERKKEGSWVGGEGLGRVLGGELGSGGVGEGRMREKIAEIRAMARAARESEEKSLSGNGGVPSTADGIGDSKTKTNVEVEVDRRLSKVEKKLQSIAGKSGSALVNYVVKDRDRKVSEREESNVKDEKMVFKKKLKFKSPSTKLNSKAKGFGNVNDGGRINGKGRRASKTSKYSIGTNATNGDSNSSVMVGEEESSQLVEDRSLKDEKTNKHGLVDKWSSSIDTEKKDDEEGESSAIDSAMTSGSSNSKSSKLVNNEDNHFYSLCSINKC
ncbi:hypothetical protein Syun_028817 [Stephania yunnanensis]|uniref:Uncharacterized protein n=1 Tax=Stephania yunnanensis TaxID=152371 RepID=A0AAP0EC66_9MAGN